MTQPNNDEVEKPGLLNKNLKKIIFFVGALFCLTPFVSPTLALLLGLSIALFVGHPFLSINNKITQILLKISVVGLGFGMNVHSALKAGKLKILTDKSSTVLYNIQSGFAEILNNKATVLVEGAEEL